MKTFYGLLLASLLSTSAIANTVHVAQQDYDAYARDNYLFSNRFRFSLGNDWSDGAANLTVVVNYLRFGEGGSYQTVRFGLASSDNPEFMTAVPYYYTTCGVHGCIDWPLDGTEHFTTNGLNDRVTPDFVPVTPLAATLPPSASWDPYSETLTLSFLPMLQSGKSYYLFAEVSGVVASHDTSWGATLSQVPVPAAAWLFGSSILGLAGISRRLKKGR